MYRDHLNIQCHRSHCIANMTKHFFVLAFLALSSSSEAYDSPIKRPETREARAGFYVNIGDYVDPNLCDSTDGLGKGSYYYFVEQPATMDDQVTSCLLDLPNDGTTASRPVNINSQQENDCLVKYINRGKL